MLTLLYFALLCLLATVEGAKDGLIYGRMGADSLPMNEHTLYLPGRGTWLVLTPLGWWMHYLGMSFWPLLGVTAAFVLAFTFCHQFAYFTIRHAISSDQPKWSMTTQSSTSTSRWEIGAKGRNRMALVALVILGLTLYIF